MYMYIHVNVRTHTVHVHVYTCNQGQVKENHLTGSSAAYMQSMYTCTNMYHIMYIVHVPNICL